MSLRGSRRCCTPGSRTEDALEVPPADPRDFRKVTAVASPLGAVPIIKDHQVRTPYAVASFGT
jgi:hypothetical protein